MSSVGWCLVCARGFCERLDQVEHGGSNGSWKGVLEELRCLSAFDMLGVSGCSGNRLCPIVNGELWILSAHVECSIGFKWHVALQVLILDFRFARMEWRYWTCGIA